jgi:hypothetical protein
VLVLQRSPGLWGRLTCEGLPKEHLCARRNASIDRAYARLEQGGPVFALQECSITDLAQQVVDEQQVLHTDVAISMVAPETTEGCNHSDLEPRYMHRALQNLVGNAARYATEKVLVTCQCDEQTCRVDVEDDGPGIPEKDWEKVFVAFSRLDNSRTRRSGGYGLGLSIVRRILFWHGGQSFISQRQHLGGARFSLVLPRKLDGLHVFLPKDVFTFVLALNRFFVRLPLKRYARASPGRPADQSQPLPEIPGSSRVSSPGG